MTETEIDYESLAQDALRGVVRTVLARVARGDKLPGNHHFYISFNTNGEGVGISKRLRDQYPEEMTIVLQHRYWDLQVHDDRVEVSLTFNSIPERLVIPFTAIKVFFDPSVPYGLQFESAGAMSADALPGEQGNSQGRPLKRPPAKRQRPSNLKEVGAPVQGPRPSEPTVAEPGRADRNREASSERVRAGAPPQLPKPVQGAVDPNPAQVAGTPDPTAKPAGQVVRLDTFRKK